MGKKIRITRKSLKQDEVRSYGVELWTWARQNEKSILIATAVVAALLLFVQAYSCRKAGREARVDLLITSALSNVQQGLFVKDDANREKLFGAAEDSLQMIVSDYRRSRTAPYADYLLGNIAFFRNNYDDAEKYYQEYLARARTPTEKAEGHIALGYTYENKFFWTRQRPEDRVWLEKALDRYVEAESLTSGTMEHYIAMLGRARLYDLQLDRREQAKELYEQIARERQLPAVQHSSEVKRSRYEWVVSEMERMRRLFSISETARLRAERLEAAK